MQNVLQKNLSRILKEKQIKIPEAERRAGLNTNTIRHILNGSSKNPSLNTIKTIADSLDTTVDILLAESSPYTNFDEEKLVLFEKIVSNVVQRLIYNQHTDITFDQVNKIVYEVFLYAIDTHPFSVDERFMDWSIKTHLNKNK